jgi:hypothetical protein
MRACTPVQVHLARWLVGFIAVYPFVEHMLCNRLDRSKSSSTRKQHHRPGIVFTQEKRAERRFDAQDVALLDRRFDRPEQAIRKHTARSAPDMQLDQLVGVWCSCDRILAARAIPQDEIEILSGAKLQSLVSRQLQRDHRYIGCGPIDLCDACRHFANRDVAEASELACLYDNVA